MTTTGQKNTSSVRRDLVENFKDKHYRDVFVAEQIFSGLPLKIRKLREAKFPTQKAFAEGLGKHQSWVSQLENPNYGKLTLTTLLEVASTLDVALEVDFVPFSRMIDRSSDLSPDWFTVSSFDDEVESLEEESMNAALDDRALFYRPSEQPIGYVTSETRELLADEESATVIPTLASEAPYAFAIGTDKPLEDYFAFHSDIEQQEPTRVQL